jgi:hypothetical protein
MSIDHEADASYRGVMARSRRRLLSLGVAAGMATLLEGPRTHAEAKEKNVPTFAINVRSYGVQGDAATDDTAAFQYALDDACKSGGGTVYVPPGMYLFRGTLTIPEGVTLRGSFSCVPSHNGIRDKDGRSWAKTEPRFL